LKRSRGEARGCTRRNPKNIAFAEAEKSIGEGEVIQKETTTGGGETKKRVLLLIQMFALEEEDGVYLSREKKERMLGRARRKKLTMTCGKGGLRGWRGAP